MASCDSRMDVKVLLTLITEVHLTNVSSFWLSRVTEQQLH